MCTKKLLQRPINPLDVGFKMLFAFFRVPIAAAEAESPSRPPQSSTKSLSLTKVAPLD